MTESRAELGFRHGGRGIGGAKKIWCMSKLLGKKFFQIIFRIDLAESIADTSEI
jgi:hypothetical protein